MSNCEYIDNDGEKCNAESEVMNYLSLKAKVSCFADDTCLR